jgi:7-keto-8-aminopelargonate synthetase-like enzyme
VVVGLGPSRISPAYGLLDASGAGLVEWLAEIGIGAESNPQASWSDITAAAGHQPMVMGGRQWCHWTGVRISSMLFTSSIPPLLALANPAPGYAEVTQLMSETDFDQLGSFSAVWFTSW